LSIANAQSFDTRPWNSWFHPSFAWSWISWASWWRMSSRISGYGSLVWIDVIPSQNAVKIHGCSRNFWVMTDSSHLSCAKSSFHWRCRHSRKCFDVSCSRWHEGHSGDPKCGCAFDARSGSLSLINRSSRHWSSFVNCDIDWLNIVQCTFLVSFIVHLCLSFRYWIYGGTEVASRSVVVTLRQMSFPSMSRWGCAMGIAGFPSVLLDFAALQVYRLALLSQSMLYCSHMVSGQFAFWYWWPLTCRNCGISGLHFWASVLISK